MLIKDQPEACWRFSKQLFLFASVALFNKLFFFPLITGQIQTIWAFNSQQSLRKNWLKQNTPPSNWTSQTDEIKTADDNLRVDLFFKLSNSGCALCHAVLSHTKRNKREQHESETGSLQRRECVRVFFLCYYSHIASTTWNRGLTRSDQQSASVSGIKRAHKVRELQSVWISPEEKPEAKKERPSQIEGAM